MGASYLLCFGCSFNKKLVIKRLYDFWALEKHSDRHRKSKYTTSISLIFMLHICGNCLRKKK